MGSGTCCTRNEDMILKFSFSQNNRSTSLARAQCETESETLDGASESITTCPTPLNSSADPASDDKCSKCPNPVNSSPRKPLVMLKKLSSFN